MIAKVIQTKKQQNQVEMQEQLTLVINDLQIEKQGKATLDDITESYLQEKMTEYEVKVISDASISEKKIRIKKDEEQKEFTLDEDLNIIRVENILIEDYWYSVTKELDEGIEIDNDATKVAYGKPYIATLKSSEEDVPISDIIVTMSGENIEVDISTGIINIENVTGDIKIKATIRKYLIKNGKTLIDFVIYSPNGAKGKITPYSNYMSFVTGASGSHSNYHSKEKVDLSRYTELSFKGNISSVNSHSGHLYISTDSRTTSVDGEYSSVKDGLKSSELLRGLTIYTIDISKLSGSYYLGVFGSNRTINIYDMWLDY